MLESRVGELVVMINKERAQIASGVAGIAPDCKSAKRGSPTGEGKWWAGSMPVRHRNRLLMECGRVFADWKCGITVGKFHLSIGSRVGIRPSVSVLGCLNWIYWPRAWAHLEVR